MLSLERHEKICRRRILGRKIEKLAAERGWDSWIQPYPSDPVGWVVCRKDGRVLVYQNLQSAITVLKLRARDSDFLAARNAYPKNSVPYA